jgi:hypothetical protein
MQRHKSYRHQKAARARWRAAEMRAQDEREAGIPDRTDSDCRQPIEIDLRSYGGQRLRIEPRRGYVASRAIDADTGQVVACAAIKTLLRDIAGSLPRMLAARNFTV